MPTPPVTKALRVAYVDAIGQCQRCFAIVTFDAVDVTARTPLIHKPPIDGQRMVCGGTLKLFQETRKYA